MLTNSLKETNELQPKKLANELSVSKRSINNTTDALGY
jgi:plasmid maintenance system antidote protein VapI